MKVLDKNDRSFKPVYILLCVALVLVLHSVIHLFIAYIQNTWDLQNPFYANLFRRSYGLNIFELFICIAALVTLWVGIWLGAQCVCDRKCCKVTVLGIMLIVSLGSTAYAWQAKNTLMKAVESKQKTYQQNVDIREARNLFQPTVVQSNKFNALTYNLA